MTAPTALLPPDLVQDLNATLARLRQARHLNDANEVRVAERRLNWLLDTRIPRRRG